MLRIAIAAAVVLFAPRLADACSVTSTFIPPTNFELVGAADTIVVAKAESEQNHDITFTISSLIKGSGLAPGATLHLAGIPQYRGRSAPDDFSKARPGAFAGGCIAYDYAVGHSFLLMLSRTDHGWIVAGPPFSRVNEEVDAKGDAWTTAVREYARVAALPTPAGRSRELHALETRATSAGDRAIAADIAAHFAAPTPSKSFAELEPMLRAHPGDRQILLAIGLGGDPAARAFMAGVVGDLAKQLDGEALAAVAAYYEKVADPAAMQKLGEIYVALGPKHQEERWPVMWLLVHHADGTQ